MKQVLALVGVGVVVMAGFLTWLVRMPALVQPEGVVSQQRYAPGPYPVIREAFAAVDKTRPTNQNRTYAGSDRRVFKGSIWRPAGITAPMPLLIYSHGFMSFYEEGAYLAAQLASRGYTVVSVNYPLTHYFAPGKPSLEDVVNQPADVSFLIDTVLARNTDKTDVLYNTVDPERIAVAGLSLGGLTSELVGFHAKVYDKRIQAVVSIAGPAAMLTPPFFRAHPVPFMMIGGDIDAMVPYDVNAAPIPQLYPGSVLVTIKGGSHAGFSGMAATFLRFFDNPDSVGCAKLKEGVSDLKNNFLDSLVGAEYGVEVRDRRMPCEQGVPAKAMQAARQQMFTVLAVSAFLDSVFQPSAQQRDEATVFLRQQLSQENNRDVSVTD